MKDMSAVTMDINSFFLGAMDVSASMRATINDQTALADLL
jgi:hypothetical protein